MINENPLVKLQLLYAIFKFFNKNWFGIITKIIHVHLIISVRIFHFAVYRHFMLKQKKIVYYSTDSFVNIAKVAFIDACTKLLDLTTKHN